jgi:hypothetical protein
MNYVMEMNSDLKGVNDHVAEKRIWSHAARSNQ